MAAEKPGKSAENEPEELIQVAGNTLRPRIGGMLSADDVRAAIDAAREAAGGESVDEELEAQLRTVKFDVRSNLNKRLDKYLVDRIGFLSRSRIQKLIDEGGVTLNGKVTKASADLHKGDTLMVVVPLPPAKNIQPEDIPLDVLFEDEHLIVLNKQPDIIVHPARSHITGTMLSALEFHFRNRSQTGGALSKVGDEFARPGVVHRLDRYTSGCIVFAKNDEVHWKIAKQFEARTVDKRYLALVQGLVEPSVDVIELPIGPHPSREKGYREKNVVRHDELGRHAVTIYRVREIFDCSGEPVAPPEQKRSIGWEAEQARISGPRADRNAKFFSLVELELKTGRTHQIRVHLSHNNWPIVGDDMYGGKNYSDSAGNELITRQALHATMLKFRHPVTEKDMVFTAPLRGDFARTVRSLRKSSRHEILTPTGAIVDINAVMAHIEED